MAEESEGLWPDAGIVLETPDVVPGTNETEAMMAEESEGLGPDAGIVLETPDVVPGTNETEAMMAEESEGLGPDAGIVLETPEVEKEATIQDLINALLNLEFGGNPGLQWRRRVLSPESLERKNELIYTLQRVVYLAVRKGYQKPIEKAADEILKRWASSQLLLDFDHFDHQVSVDSNIYGIASSELN